MADFSITVRNSINTFGPAPTDKWGSPFTWGSSLWGEGDQVISTSFFFPKTISNSITCDSSVALASSRFILLSDSISQDFEMSNENLQDPNGYFHVFAKPSTNAEDRVMTSFTSEPRVTTSWSQSTGASTTWS
jgi:hypothetical protein